MPTTFKKLHVGAAFSFAAEAGVDGLVWQGARGPWVKVGPSTYRAAEAGYAQGPTIKVGAPSVEVVPA